MMHPSGSDALSAIPSPSSLGGKSNETRPFNDIADAGPASLARHPSEFSSLILNCLVPGSNTKDDAGMCCRNYRHADTYRRSGGGQGMQGTG